MTFADLRVQHAAVALRLTVVMTFGQRYVTISIEACEVIVISLLYPAVEIGCINLIRVIEDRVFGSQDHDRRSFIDHAYIAIHTRRKWSQVFGDEIGLLILDDQRSTLHCKVEKALVVCDECGTRL